MRKFCNHKHHVVNPFSTAIQNIKVPKLHQSVRQQKIFVTMELKIMCSTFFIAYF